MSAMSGKARLCLTIFFLLAPLLGAGAAPGHVFSGGIIFSPKGCGVMFRSEGESSAYRILVRSDFQGIITGKEEVPGVVASIAMEYPLKKWTTGAGEARLHVGPSVSAGYVCDKDREHGLLVSVGCTGGADFSFRGSPIEISLDFSAEIGVHVVVRDISHDASTNFYRNGLRKLLEPELTIRYRF